MNLVEFANLNVTLIFRMHAKLDDQKALFRSLIYNSFGQYYCERLTPAEYEALVEKVAINYNNAIQKEPYKHLQNHTRPKFNEIIASTIVAIIFKEVANVVIEDSDSIDDIIAKHNVAFPSDFPLSNQFLVNQIGNFTQIEKQILQLESRILWEQLFKLRAKQKCQQLTMYQRVRETYTNLIEQKKDPIEIKKRKTQELVSAFKDANISPEEKKYLAQFLLQRKFKFLNNKDSKSLFILVLGNLCEMSLSGEKKILSEEYERLIGLSISKELRENLLKNSDKFQSLKEPIKHCCGEQMWHMYLKDRSLQHDENFISEMFENLSHKRISELSKDIVKLPQTLAKPLLKIQLDLINADAIKLDRIPIENYRALVELNRSQEIIPHKKLLGFLAPYGHNIFNHRIISALNSGQFVFSKAISPVIIMFPMVCKCVMRFMEPSPLFVFTSVSICFVAFEAGVVIINLTSIVLSKMGYCDVDLKEMKLLNPPDWLMDILDNACNICIATNFFNFRALPLPIFHVLKEKAMEEGRGEEGLITDKILPIANVLLLFLFRGNIKTIIEGTIMSCAYAMVKLQARVWVGLLDNSNLQSYIDNLPGPARRMVQHIDQQASHISPPPLYIPVPMR